MSERLESLTAKALEALPRGQTAFLFSVGALEDHGPHLPLGLDLFEARAIAEETALRIERDLPGWTAVLMPALPLGVDSNTTRIAFTTRGYALRDCLVDQCGTLARLGFEHFICLSGSLGPKQLTAIEEAGKLVRRRYGRGLIRRKVERRQGAQLMSASSALINLDTALASPAWPDLIEHGGPRDTSVALAVSPGQVDEIFKALPEQRRTDGFTARAWSRFRRQTQGYWGARPGDATAEKGRQEIARVLEAIFPKIRATLEGADANRLFRSWYSLFPFNGSYFKAWLLALGLCLLIALWVRLNYPV